MKILITISLFLFITSCNPDIGENEAHTIGKELNAETKNEESLSTDLVLSLNSSDIESTQTRIHELILNYHGNIYNERYRDTISKKELSLIISLAITSIDSFLPELTKLKTINNVNTDKSLALQTLKIKEQVKQLPTNQRFASIKLILVQEIQQAGHFWRDLGTGISGAGLALLRFALLLLKAWPVILLLLFIGYLGKFRFKAKK